MTTQQILSMQAAIGKKLSFFQWWKEQEFFPQLAMYSKDIAHIAYDEQVEILKSNLKRFKELIVTDHRGVPPESFSFVIHTNPEDAHKHGQRTLGKKRFQILTFAQFKTTPTFRKMSRRIATKNKHQRYESSRAT